MKEFKNSKTIKTNYYIVSTAEGWGKGLVQKINVKDLPEILKNKEFEFTISDPCDHIDYKVHCTYKIVEETVVTYKDYKDL